METMKSVTDGILWVKIKPLERLGLSDGELASTQQGNCPLSFMTLPNLEQCYPFRVLGWRQNTG